MAGAVGTGETAMSVEDAKCIWDARVQVVEAGVVESQLQPHSNNR